MVRSGVLRTRLNLHTLRAEADVEVDSDLSIASAHDAPHDADHHVVACVRGLTATVYVQPTGAHTT
jgi:divalent metal cation (Fe/Co/Zn/Cd) transporter